MVGNSFRLELQHILVKYVPFDITHRQGDMEHLNSCRLCPWIAFLEHHGKMDSLCEVLREQPCQILVVGIYNVFLDGLDFIPVHVRKHGERLFTRFFFPFVRFCLHYAFPYG